MNKRQRKRKTHRYALLMVRVGGYEKQYHAPVNFYNWCKKAQNHYLNKIAPNWEGCCDGVPWTMGGNSIYNYQ